jgi:hypothetical protein
MTPEALEHFMALADKRTVLTAYVQALLAQRTPANQPDIDREVGRVDAELQLVRDIISELKAEDPVSFPGATQLDEMRRAVAALQVAIDRSAALNALLAAGDAVIKAWPKLGG